MTHPVKEILMEELEIVTDAIQTGEDLSHWAERLRRVTRALQAVSSLAVFTPQEKQALLTLIEFHGNVPSSGAETPFDTRAVESARVKLQG